MTVYASSDVRSVSTPVGHVHERRVVKKGKGGAADEFEPVFAVSCPQCEPFLLETGSFASSLERVPLTPDEERRREEEKRRAEVDAAAVTDAIVRMAKNTRAV